MTTRIALAGNPNCGKTTLFNSLTGANQYVGNWPGVTVEKKEGAYMRDKSVTITDLPGIYSLSPYSPEEIVSRDYLIDERPDAVVCLVDATNLERNLYLTTQIVTLGLPVVVALNMADLIAKQGDVIDTDGLSKALGAPVVTISALKGTGVDGLMQQAVSAAQAHIPAKPTFTFDAAVEEAISAIEEMLGTVPTHLRRWYAIKLLENDEREVEKVHASKATLEKVAKIRADLEERFDDDAESIVTSEGYLAIAHMVDDNVKRSGKTMTTTEKIDRIVTNRILGIPIFVAVMFLVYFLAISTVGTGLTDWVNDGLFGDGWAITDNVEYDADYAAWEDEVAAAEATGDADTISAALGDEPDRSEYDGWVSGIPVLVSEAFESAGVAPWLESLLVDGVIAGVGAVIGFVPQMFVLFLLLSFLEGCGYMARVAFVMDRVFRKFGLSGKSFIPMLVASGCGVPAVMSTKTIENEKDRRMTIMTTTMIPCSAKMPIIALVFGAIAGETMDGVWWVAPVFYFLGVGAIIISGIMLRKTRTFAGDATPFVMELPQYHLPTVRSILMATWERCKAFLVKAGTIIFLSTIVIWFLMNLGFYEGSFGLLDQEVDDYIQYSLLAVIGNAIAWIFTPLGFGDWQATVTTITGLVAKENVVATMGVITSVGADASEADPTMWSSFAAMFSSVPAILAFCAFNLLCAPCFAAIGAIYRQMGSGKWTWIAIGYMCGFAYCVSLMIYQFGSLIAGTGTFGVGTVAAIIVAALMLWQLLRPMPHYDTVEKSPSMVATGAAEA